MRKFLYTTVALLSAFVATSCLYGIGSDENLEIEDNSGFKVHSSASIISANGEDVVTFRATYNGEDVTALSTLYNAEDDSAYAEMSFSTYVAAEYKFYVTYEEHRSQVITVTAVADLDLADREESGLTLTLSTNLVQVGKNNAVFIIRFNGKVIDAADITKVKVYNADDDSEIAFATENFESNGKIYTLPVFSATEVGTKRFWISFKTVNNTRTKPVQVTAVNTAIPSRPVDADPANLNFVRRVMLTQLTGIKCGYCPWLVSALHKIATEEEYSKYWDKYVHTAVHGAAYDNVFKVTVNNNDLGEWIHPSGNYPYLYYDLALSHSGGWGVDGDITYITTYLDGRLAQPATATIAARTELKDNMLLVRASVKAAEEGEYSVGAWLLESNLYAKQSNSTEVRGDYLDYHENVVRIADSFHTPTTSNYRGYPLGIIGAGERTDHLFVMELNPTWKVENCHLVLFVVRDNAVVNVVKSSSLISGVEFEYAK